MPVCPTCGETLAEAGGASFSLCSERCRMSDIDSRFTEDYRIQVRGSNEEFEMSYPQEG